MNIRLIVVLIIPVSIGLFSYSQDPFFSNFASNLNYINPSYVSSITNPEISVTYRNQWPGLSDAFVNYGGSFFLPITKFQSGVGFYFLNDIQGGGIVTSTSVNSIYAYKIKINSNVFLNAGLQASYFFENLNSGNLVFESDIINDSGTNYGEEIFEVLKNKFWDFSLGFMTEVNRLIYIGFSIQHLTQPGKYFSSAEDNVLFRKYSFHALSEIHLTNGNRSKTPFITPSVLFQKQGHYQQFNYGSSLIISPLLIGVWAKNDLKFNFSSLTAAVGLITSNYRLIYSYDINLAKTNLLNLNMGSHEVTFLLTFRYKEKIRNNKAIKCPKL